MKLLRAILPSTGAVLLAFLFGAASFWLFTRNNDFPLNYQPDEMSKGYQIMGDGSRRNFNHPLLLLESAVLVRNWFNVPDDMHAAVIAGRYTSAALSALGVAAFALAGYAGFAYRGLLLGGTICALCPPWLVYAHFFKEDAPLAAGVALAVLGMAWVVNTKKFWQQLIGILVLGAGCAAAVSGKYIGIVVAPACLAACLAAPGARWWRMLSRLLLFLIAATVAYMTINARAFTSFWPPALHNRAADRLEFDYNHGLTGHYGVILSKPNLYCLNVTAGQFMPHLWILLLAAGVVLLIRHKVSRWGIVLLILLASMAIILSFDTIPFDRYALPLTVALYFAAAQAIAAAIPLLFPLLVLQGRVREGASTENFSSALSNVILAIVLIVIISLQGTRCLNFNHQFATDSRQRTRDWITANIPPGSLVIAEGYTGLETPNGWGFPRSELGVQVRGKDYAADFADTPQQLAAQGAQYVVVSSQDHDRFFVRGVHSTPDRPGYVEHQRNFYEQLFAQEELIWSAVPTPPTGAFVNPEIRIYRLKPAGAAGTSTPGWSGAIRRIPDR